MCLLMGLELRATTAALYMVVLGDLSFDIRFHLSQGAILQNPGVGIGRGNRLYIFR